MRYAATQDTWPRCWMIAAVAGTAGFQLWPLGQQAGSGLFAVISAVLWLVAARNLNAGLKAWDTDAANRKVRRKTRKPRKSHGRARFATWKDIKKAKKSTLNSDKGLFLGKLDGRELFYGGEGSAMFVAGPGAGKTTSISMQHALRNPGSTIFIDTKGSMAACSADFRRRVMKNRVWMINPDSVELNAQLGGKADLVDHGFNPCAFIDPDSPNVITDCDLLARCLMPTGAKATENDDYWRTFAQELLQGFMLLALVRDGRVTLPGLRRMLMCSDEELHASIEEMEGSDAFSGVLSELGSRMAQCLVKTPKLWGSGISGAIKALKIYDAHGPLGRHVMGGEVDFRKLRDKPTTVYIIVPGDKVEAWSAWLALVVSLAMELIQRDRRNKPVTFMLDEFQNLPPMMPVLKGLALYREAGIRFAFLVQFVPALKRLYGDSWREFLGCSIFSAFGSTSDLETLKLLSDLAGQETFRSEGSSDHPERALEYELGLSMTYGEQGRPLIRPEEIRTLETGKQLIFAENLQPILADKQSYLDVRRLRRAAAPNPYYRK